MTGRRTENVVNICFGSDYYLLFTTDFVRNLKMAVFRNERREIEPNFARKKPQIT